MGRPKEYRELDLLQNLAGTARTRNGRLAINWQSRRSMPRWRMVPLNGQWYNRGRLRATVQRRPKVPHSGRALTAEELANALNTNPWSLAPGRRQRNARG